jgi:hypothetical protein
LALRESAVIYMLLKFAHQLGAIPIGGGLIAVWVSDLRSRQLRELPAFAESCGAWFYQADYLAVVCYRHGAALVIAGFLTAYVHKLYPWGTTEEDAA